MKRAFWFHYNKPASRAAGAPRLTIHHEGQCKIVRSLECSVPIATRFRSTQPHCVMAGVASSVVLSHGHAKIS